MDDKEQEIAELKARLERLETPMAADPVPPETVVPASAPAPERQVGYLLGTGILFLPLVFAWFTLRNGHSRTARTVAFGWMGIGLFIWIVTVMATSSSTPTVAAAAADVTAPPGDNTTATAPAAPEPPQILMVGQVISVGDINLTVTNVQEAASVGSSYLSQAAAQDGVLVVVDYTVKNISAKPVSAGDIPKFALLDPADTTYSEDAGATSMYEVEHHVDQKLWSNLNPGITVRSAQVFEVAKNSFNPATWSLIIGDDKAAKIHFQ
jgi:hypothetical protein